MKVRRSVATKLIIKIAGHTFLLRDTMSLLITKRAAQEMAMAQEKKVFNDDEIQQRLAAGLPNWELRDGWIRRKYQTGGWPFTLMVVNAIGYIAEAGFHHPDLSVTWAQVQVKLQTHSAGGVTENDFELAQLIEQHVTWLPEEDAALEGFEKGFKKKWTR